jgi:hypothetical protein
MISGMEAVEPEQYLPYSQRIMQHIKDHARDDGGFCASYALTQDGIGNAVGISRGHAALVLRKLVVDGSLTWELRHIKDDPIERTKIQRRRIYLPANGNNVCQGKMIALSEFVLRAYGVQGAICLMQILQKRV